MVSPLRKAHQAQTALSVAQKAGEMLLPLAQVGNAAEGSLDQKLRFRIPLSKGGESTQFIAQLHPAILQGQDILEPHALFRRTAGKLVCIGDPQQVSDRLDLFRPHRQARRTRMAAEAEQMLPSFIDEGV